MYNLYLGNTTNFCSIQRTAHYSWEILPCFVQYSLQPIISFERGSNCAEHAINLSNMYLYFRCSQRYSTQFTAESMSVQDAWSSQKLVGIQQSWSVCLKFQLRFHAKYVVSLQVSYFFQQGNALKAKYRWCMQRSRFKCSQLIFWRIACSIWTYSFFEKHPWTAWKDAEHFLENAEFAAGNCTHICSMSNIYFSRNIDCNSKNQFVIIIYIHTW